MRKTVKGYSIYIRALHRLPGTADDVAEELGISVRSASHLIKHLRAVGLAHVSGVLPGRGQKLIYGRFGNKKQFKEPPTVMAIAIALLFETLKEGATVRELMREAEMAQVSVLNCLKLMKRFNMARIVGWNINAAIWQLGSGKNKPKPKPKTDAELTRDWRHRKARFDGYSIPVFA